MSTSADEEPRATPPHETPDAKPDAKPERAADASRRWPADVPSRSACRGHADCTIAVTAAVDDPCCEQTVTAMPVTVAYMRYFETYRKAHCAEVACPPLLLPGARPSACAETARCIDGECSHACNDSSWTGEHGR